MDIDRLVEYSPSNKYESTISYIYVMYIKFVAYNIIYGIYIHSPKIAGIGDGNKKK